MIGDSSPRPLGIPSDACISLPFSFSNCLYGVCVFFVVSRMSLHMAIAFVSGRMMQRVTPSKSHPSISLRVSHMPSPCCSFFTEIESLFGLFASAGKIECMPCSMARVAWSMVSCVGVWSMAMKSSTKTSRTLASLSALVLVMFGSFNAGGMQRCSSGCGGSEPSGLCSNCWARSRAVSLAVQKNGGDSHHPICKLVGMTICNGWFLSVRGST